MERQQSMNHYVCAAVGSTMLARFRCAFGDKFPTGRRTALETTTYVNINSKPGPEADKLLC
jgi:hypothetical protein